MFSLRLCFGKQWRLSYFSYPYRNNYMKQTAKIPLAQSFQPHLYSWNFFLKLKSTPMEIINPNVVVVWIHTKRSKPCFLQVNVLLQNVAAPPYSPPIANPCGNLPKISMITGWKPIVLYFRHQANRKVEPPISNNVIAWNYISCQLNA